MTKEGTRALKRAAAEGRELRIRRENERHRAERRRERACFWLRPWGHVWSGGECVVCGKDDGRDPGYL
jgi:hypothetical protein